MIKTSTRFYKGLEAVLSETFFFLIALLLSRVFNVVILTPIDMMIDWYQWRRFQRFCHCILNIQQTQLYPQRQLYCPLSLERTVFFISDTCYYELYCVWYLDWLTDEKEVDLWLSLKLSWQRPISGRIAQ